MMRFITQTEVEEWKKFTDEWKKSNHLALEKVTDYALSLPDTLYAQLELRRKHSNIPNHMLGFNNDLKEYVCVPFSTIERDRSHQLDQSSQDHSIDKVVSATLPNGNSLEVAAKVMEKALANAPQNIREEAITKMTNAAAKGLLKLPQPKVLERTIDKPLPEPAQNMGRSR